MSRGCCTALLRIEGTSGRFLANRVRYGCCKPNRRLSSFPLKQGQADEDVRSRKVRKGVITMAERWQDEEEQREISRMSGRASHGGRGREDDDDRFHSRGPSRDEPSGRSRRGFAAMDPEEQREIARMGGRASHEYGRGHEFTSEEAREAGRKGGQARWR
jgi:general stress protein YciG